MQTTPTDGVTETQAGNLEPLEALPFPALDSRTLEDLAQLLLALRLGLLAVHLRHLARPKQQDLAALQRTHCSGIRSQPLLCLDLHLSQAGSVRLPIPPAALVPVRVEMLASVEDSSAMLQTRTKVRLALHQARPLGALSVSRIQLVVRPHLVALQRRLRPLGRSKEQGPPLGLSARIRTRRKTSHCSEDSVAAMHSSNRAQACLVADQILAQALYLGVPAISNSKAHRRSLEALLISKAVLPVVSLVPEAANKSRSRISLAVLEQGLLQQEILDLVDLAVIRTSLVRQILYLGVTRNNPNSNSNSSNNSDQIFLDRLPPAIAFSGQAVPMLIRTLDRYSI